MNEKKILEYIENYDSKKLISLIKSEQKENVDYSDIFKKEIKNTNLHGKTAMDIALALYDRELTFLLVEGGFYDAPLREEMQERFTEHKNSTRNMLKILIMEKPEKDNIGIISAIFLGKPCLPYNFLRQLVEHCLNSISYTQDHFFKNNILDGIIAVPKYPHDWLEIIFDIHITRLDATGLKNFFYSYSDAFKIHKEKQRKVLLDLIEQLATVSPIDDKNDNDMEKFIKNKRFEIAKTILNELDEIKNESIEVELFLYQEKNQHNSLNLYQKIVTYSIDHVNENDDYLFCQLLEIVFKKCPFLIKNILMPLSFTFQKPLTGKRNRIYYCDSFFAVAAIKQNMALYNLLQKHIDFNGENEIKKHRFYIFSPITEIRFFYKPCTEIKIKNLEKNKKYLFIFPHKTEERCQFYFSKTDKNSHLIQEKKLEINIKKSTCIGENAKIRGKRLQTLIEKLYEEHSHELPILEEMGYYQTGSVEKSFPMLIQEKIALREDLAQLEKFRVQAKKEVDFFSTLRQRQKTSSKSNFSMDDNSIIPSQPEQASAAHLISLSFAMSLRDNHPNAKNIVDANLRYELNSLLSSLLVVLHEIVKHSKKFSISSIIPILDVINSYLIEFSTNKEFIEIIDDFEKTNIVNEGLSLLLSPTVEKHGEKRFNFLSRAKEFYFKATAPDPTKLAQGMNITNEENSSISDVKL